LHGRQRRAGRERSHLGTLAGRWRRNGPIGSAAFAFTEGPAKSHEGARLDLRPVPKRRSLSPEHAK
jgi:hypothetical protein